MSCLPRTDQYLLMLCRFQVILNSEIEIIVSLVSNLREKFCSNSQTIKRINATVNLQFTEIPQNPQEKKSRGVKSKDIHRGHRCHNREEHQPRRRSSPRQGLGFPLEKTTPSEEIVGNGASFWFLQNLSRISARNRRKRLERPVGHNCQLLGLLFWADLSSGFLKRRNFMYTFCPFGKHPNYVFSLLKFIITYLPM